MDRSEYSTKDWFRIVRELGRDAYLSGEPRAPDFKDFDECDEWYAGYDAAKAEAACCQTCRGKPVEAVVVEIRPLPRKPRVEFAEHIRPHQTSEMTEHAVWLVKVDGEMRGELHWHKDHGWGERFALTMGDAHALKVGEGEYLGQHKTRLAAMRAACRWARRRATVK